jgi:serine/threonine protein kinase
VLLTFSFSSPSSPCSYSSSSPCPILIFIVLPLRCVLYEAATLSPPFTAPNQAALAVAIDEGVFAPIDPLDYRGYSSEFCDAVSWMLRRNREHRPTTTDLLKMELPSTFISSAPSSTSIASASGADPSFVCSKCQHQQPSSSSAVSPLIPSSSPPPPSSSSSSSSSFASSLLDARSLVLRRDREQWEKKKQAEQLKLTQKEKRIDDQVRWCEVWCDERCE